MEILIKSLYPSFQPQKDKIISWIEQALTALKVQADELSLIFVSNLEIRAYNRKYRNINRESDVLSFPLGEKSPDGRINLGDIIISIEAAKRQSQDMGHSLEEELKILIIHGLLHLLDYNHETDNGEMHRREQELLAIL